MRDHELVVWFDHVGMADVALVGGKNASLGELTRGLKDAGVQVPAGFATTARAYWLFLEVSSLEELMRRQFELLAQGKTTIQKAGKIVRDAILTAELPAELADAVRTAYAELCRQRKRPNVHVAVRSSATAEDLPGASFAGQHETYLNVSGIENVLEACRKCYASLFTDRAIEYREINGFDHLKVALSIGVQEMVRADTGGSGVMFSIDTETGFPDIAVINAAWGMGENVVQGTVDPDEYVVFKPLLGQPNLVPIIGKKLGTKEKKLVWSESPAKPTRNVPTSARERAASVLQDGEVLRLARWVTAIERHYGKPMDVEWARDGETGELFVVQARPETVQSRKEASWLREYRLGKKGRRIVTGLAIGDAIATGSVCRLDRPGDSQQFPDGAILVTRVTDPDWLPVMKRASAIVTDHGGRTSHAAIVSRELGLPAIVGTGQATSLLRDGQTITVSCAEGDEGHVYEGAAEFQVQNLDLAGLPATRTHVMLNLAEPAAAFRWWRLPADGVGLARMEFIISNSIKIHPMALLAYPHLKDANAKRQIKELTVRYADKAEYFVDLLAQGIARLAAAHYPRPVIVRMSDFKTNEYANLIGGAEFEPHEENPMLGFRGASRYYDAHYRPGFVLECRAIGRVRERIGLRNVIVMIPFCRTLDEARRVIEVMEENGLPRGENGLELYVMCEIPANVILAEQFSHYFDGFSIGSNDLTQLVLGVDRDSAALAGLFDERNEAVTRMISSVISTAHQCGRKVGLCGQAPSDHPQFAEFLVKAGIDSVSVSPDSFLEVKRHVAAAEARQAEAARRLGEARRELVRQPR